MATDPSAASQDAWQASAKSPGPTQDSRVRPHLPPLPVYTLPELEVGGSKVKGADAEVLDPDLRGQWHTAGVPGGHLRGTVFFSVAGGS